MHGSSMFLLRALGQLRPIGASGGTIPSLLWRAPTAQPSSGHGDDTVQQRNMTFSAYDVGSSTNIKWHEGAVPTVAKEVLLDQRGCVLWFTGLSGSGKSTVACTLEHALAERGKATALLDGDNVRHGLNRNLGFSEVDRAENIRRIGEVARLFQEAGIITLCSFISPYRRDRDAVRARLPAGRFVEVYMKVPLELCEKRDPKGLYKKARAGQLKNFTGLDDPYEEPQSAELVLDAYDKQGRQRSPESMAAEMIQYLEAQALLEGPQN